MNSVPVRDSNEINFPIRAVRGTIKYICTGSRETKHTALTIGLTRN